MTQSGDGAGVGKFTPWLFRYLSVDGTTTRSGKSEILVLTMASPR
jgi:hypothetical protein